MNMLFVMSGMEKVTLIVLYLFIAVGAVLIVRDVIIEFKKIYDYRMNHKDDDELL